MMIRPFTTADLQPLSLLWNACCDRGELLFRPFDAAYFTEKFLSAELYEPDLLLTAELDGHFAGFVAGCRKHRFLNGESDASTPGYLSAIMVDPGCRRKGMGSALLTALENKFRALGKSSLDVSSTSPINLDWLIPGTPSHEHNNMPGMDEGAPAYPFLIRHGFTPRAHEVAMYLNLSDYSKSEAIEQKRAELAQNGINAGRYDVKEACEWDGMCDRVGSEYWREVLRSETASPAPRPILAARTKGHIVGFTGPVDVQTNGRGWFTGICTDSLYEKRGIATVLFNDLMCEFIQHGARYSSLFTGTENHAQRLYLRTGFRPVRQFAIMRKELSL